MGRWLDGQGLTVQVYEPVTGKRYAFQPRRSDPNKGYIKIKCRDGLFRSVAGTNNDGVFITNPRGKNATQILTQEMIDLQIGTTVSATHEEIPANMLGPRPNEWED